MAQLKVDAPKLGLLGVDALGDEAGQPEGLPLGLGEGRRLVQARVAKEVHAAGQILTEAVNVHDEMTPWFRLCSRSAADL